MTFLFLFFFFINKLYINFNKILPAWNRSSVLIKLKSKMNEISSGFRYPDIYYFVNIQDIFSEKKIFKFI